MEALRDETRAARVLDAQRQDRGWAQTKTRRPNAIGRLTVLDVVTNDSQLASFLEGLDHSGLHIQCADVEGTSYEFEGASGYANGSQIRIRGVLVGG
jgi:hypothetical protein